jgi:hypothetical protein
MLSHYGMLIGLTLVLIATGTAFAIIAKAARGIEQFRHEDHELFERQHRC